MDPRSAEDEFDAITRTLRSRRGVETGTRFGSNPGLRMGGKIFAMLVRGSLVLKMPQERVTAIVAAGDGVHFDAGRGRVMKEWVAIDFELRAKWATLTEEAFEFVARSKLKARG